MERPRATVIPSVLGKQLTWEELKGVAGELRFDHETVVEKFETLLQDEKVAAVGGDENHQGREDMELRAVGDIAFNTRAGKERFAMALEERLPGLVGQDALAELRQAENQEERGKKAFIYFATLKQKLASKMDGKRKRKEPAPGPAPQLEIAELLRRPETLEILRQVIRGETADVEAGLAQVNDKVDTQGKLHGDQLAAHLERITMQGEELQEQRATVAQHASILQDHHHRSNGQEERIAEATTRFAQRVSNLQINMGLRQRRQGMHIHVHQTLPSAVATPTKTPSLKVSPLEGTTYHEATFANQRSIIIDGHYLSSFDGPRTATMIYETTIKPAADEDLHFMFIGPSGSGKTTLNDHLLTKMLNVPGWDLHSCWEYTNNNKAPMNRLTKAEGHISIIANRKTAKTDSNETSSRSAMRWILEFSQDGEKQGTLTLWDLPGDEPTGTRAAMREVGSSTQANALDNQTAISNWIAKGTLDLRNFLAQWSREHPVPGRLPTSWVDDIAKALGGAGVNAGRVGHGDIGGNGNTIVAHFIFFWDERNGKMKKLMWETMMRMAS